MITAPAGELRETDPMLPRPFTVRAVRHDTADTATLALAPLDGDPLRFAPGQFTMIGRPGLAEVPISISGDAAEPGRLELTVRGVGDATAALAGAEPGERLLVRGPYGTGWTVPDVAGADVVIVAGGIGLAPLRPALLQVLRRRAEFGRVEVVYGGRTPDNLLYRAQLERWRHVVDVSVTVDVAQPGWRGPVGLVTRMLPDDVDPARTSALICGPEVMMRLTAEALLARGLGAERIQISMERDMKCGVGLCGHCQLRELFVCLDGPVLSYDRVRPLMTVRGL
ncbi:MAG: FAD/NAD(P)-binding protein [Kineosporiaceae bacterium]